MFNSRSEVTAAALLQVALQASFTRSSGVNDEERHTPSIWSVDVLVIQQVTELDAIFNRQTRMITGKTQ
jgi:hypothetical protein